MDFNLNWNWWNQTVSIIISYHHPPTHKPHWLYLAISQLPPSPSLLNDRFRPCHNCISTGFDFRSSGQSSPQPWQRNWNLRRMKTFTSRRRSECSARTKTAASRPTRWSSCWARSAAWRRPRKWWGLSTGTAMASSASQNSDAWWEPTQLFSRNQ